MKRIIDAGTLAALVVTCLTAQVACRGRRADETAAAPRAELPAMLLSQSAATVECYDFIDITLRIPAPAIGNPFTDASVSGAFGLDDRERVTVDGFSDSADGSLFRVRFMPSVAGTYTYSIR